MSLQYLGYAQVYSHDPENHGVYVLLPSGQKLSSLVEVGFDGPADALRINQNELPGRGTCGLVAFPYGVAQNGIWLKSIRASLGDAITSGPDQPFTRYRSHFSGHYEILDDDGRYCQYFPDGTYVVFSDTKDKPKIYRHIVDANQKQQRIEATPESRNPNIPSPRYVHLNHVTGTTCDINPNGDVEVDGNPNATLTLKFGSTTFVIDPQGNMTATGATGATYKVDFNNTTIVVDPSGNLVCTGAAAAVLQLLSHAGQLTMQPDGSATYNGMTFTFNAPVVMTQGMNVSQSLSGQKSMVITGDADITSIFTFKSGSQLKNPDGVDLLPHKHMVSSTESGVPID